MKKKVVIVAAMNYTRWVKRKAKGFNSFLLKFKVIETVSPQYSCRHCEKTETKVQIKIAPVPLSAIPKSIATPSLLSQMITNKFQYALPIYRQEVMFKHHGIILSRKNMSGWMIKSSTPFKLIIDY
jgi:transposase